MIDFTLQEKYNEEVYHSSSSIIDLNREDINQLILLANSAKRTRVRFCAHSNSSEALHEMFIVHSKDTYVRPHKHLKNLNQCWFLKEKLSILLFMMMDRLKIVFKWEHFSQVIFFIIQ
ncbi:hypothetical protein LKM2_1497 [Leptospira kirschneri serovar Mozdok]|nr:hypothetical protein [Leptospira kirschneri serovar Mozdok]